MNDALLVRNNFSRVERLFEKIPEHFQRYVAYLSKTYNIDIPTYYGRTIPNERFVINSLPGWSMYWLGQSNNDSYQAVRFDRGRLQIYYFQSYDNDRRDRSIQYLHRLNHAMNDMLYERRQAFKFIRITPSTTLINVSGGVNTYIFQSEYEILLG